MSDAVAAPAAKASPKKKTTKPKVPAAHPQYKVMIAAAITSLKERGGSSRQAIMKYIMANYKVGNNPVSVNAHLKTALKAGVKGGALKQAKGVGATGSFRLGEKKVQKKPKVKKTKTVKKPAAKKTAKPKKPAAKKTTTKSPAKKAAKPKKPAVKKTTKPKKAATTKKSPKKAPAKKPAAKKPATKKPATKKTAAKK